MDQQLDYDSCAQFLARLDDGAQQANSNSSESPSADRLSPFDAYNSASPPGLSSGSVTSHSPESLRYDWDPSEPAFFTDINDPTGGVLPDSGTWDPLILPEPNSSVPPMGDFAKYNKIETGSPGYFAEPTGTQGTISPSSSLIDPTAQTAWEGGYAFPKESDGLFDFNSFGGQPGVRQNSGEFSPMWRTREDFQAQNWQQQQQQQQQQQTLQRPQQSIPTPPQQPNSVRRNSPLRNSRSPPAFGHPASSPESHADAGSNSDEAAPTPAPKSKKRKTAPDDPPSDGSPAAQPAPATNGRKQPKKTAHNMIEKRYRTNLNVKIAALRDSVPSLRVMAGTARLGEDDEEEDLEGLAPAHKLNKATVLAKATEYIRHLEKRNKRLQDENDQLKNRLNAFEKLATMGGTMGLQPQPGHPGGRGGQASGGPGGGLMSRLMVGSLAGLMIANGLQSHESGRSELAAMALPMEWMGVTMPARTDLVWLVAKFMLLFSAVVYVISPGFFDAKEQTEDPKASTQSNVAAAPSLASPLKDRTHAWLTAIQTVWVPRHSVALELAALGLKALKLSMRRLVGWERYQMLTGMTEEEEAARIKSWTIALDAQLTGGDISINNSRLLLTLLASWTLPAAPGRLMLNSLHIRILFRRLGFGLEDFAKKFCNYYWVEARKANETAIEEDDTSVEQLPPHLAALLECDPEEVFDEVILTQAYNLAYNIESDQEGMDEGMASVTQDVSIRSPLDALGAWYSSFLLQGVLVASLKTKSSAGLSESIQADLDTAIKIAPPSSGVQLRALATKTVLVEEDGEKFLNEAIKIFQEDCQSKERAVNNERIFMAATPVNSAVTTTADIRISLRCGMALVLMRNGARDQATRLFSDLDWKSQVDKNNLGLLGFVAAWKTLTTFITWDSDWANDAGDSVDRAAAMLRIWVGDKKIPKFGVSRGDCKRVINFCNSLQKKLAGLEEGDDGYVSGEPEVKH